ncbi:MAG: toprim domain-containing protein [Planctomycetaceae bacterium]
MDISKRRYGKIIVMTDADVDGSHIRTLLPTFLFRHMRDLVAGGRVYIAQPAVLIALSSRGVRYVQTHQAMMTELISLGMNGARVTVKADGTTFSVRTCRNCVTFVTMEHPLNRSNAAALIFVIC